MKNILILIALMGFAAIGWSQEKMTSYDNSYIEKTYDISTYFPDNNKFTLYIDALSIDEYYEKTGFRITHKQYEDFVQAIKKAKIKYSEWVQTAIENEVTDMDKQMSISCKVGGYFYGGDEWKFDDFVSPIFNFRITDNSGESRHMLVVLSGTLNSSTNSYIDAKGAALVFMNEGEIDSFLEKISIEEIEEFRSKPDKKDLFKD